MHNHKVMFFIGLIFPILWIVGAVWHNSKPAYQPGMRT